MSITGGMLATFSADREVTICDDKSVPIGFFIQDIDIKNHGRSHGDAVVSVVLGQGEYETDIFEKSDYKIQNFLYCSCNGKISDEERYRGNIIIGIVNSVSDDKIGFITCFARGLETK
jgi:hypothetical protein